MDRSPPEPHYEKRPSPFCDFCFGDMPPNEVAPSFFCSDQCRRADPSDHTLIDVPFRVIVADPPWAHTAQGGKRGASQHYPLMRLGQIESYLVDERISVAKDAVLFLWRVASMQEEALRVCRAWGFVPKTEMVWIKRTKTGKLAFGMGSYVRGAHETCLIAVRGSCRPQVLNVRSVFEAPLGKHSVKPERFFDVIEQMYAGPRAERFARRRRRGWVSYGNEVPSANECSDSDCVS